MASRNNTNRNSKSSVTKIQLMVDTRCIIRGNVSGKLYTFNGAGSVIFVDAKDVPGLLNYRRWFSVVER